MEKTLKAEEERKSSKFQWFIVVIVIPAFFAITVALIVFTVAGVNVFEKAKSFSENIPFLSSGDEKKLLQSDEEIETQLTELKAEVKEREVEISLLESKLESKDKEIEQAKLEKEQLKKSIEELTAAGEENKRALNDIVNTYETMSAKKAAPIISQMSDDEALKILSSVKPDTLAGIMEQLEPANAAKFTTLLTNESYSETN